MKYRPVIILTLLFNLIIFGVYGLNLMIEVYRRPSIIQNFEKVVLFIVPIIIIGFSIIGISKNRWSILIASASAASVFAYLFYELIQWYYDPMEQGRNGGTIPIIIIVIGFLVLNIVTFILALKSKQNSKTFP